MIDLIIGTLIVSSIIGFKLYLNGISKKKDTEPHEDMSNHI